MPPVVMGRRAETALRCIESVLEIFDGVKSVLRVRPVSTPRRGSSAARSTQPRCASGAVPFGLKRKPCDAATSIFAVPFTTCSASSS
jgi:hypothetical protein